MAGALQSGDADALIVPDPVQLGNSDNYGFRLGRGGDFDGDGYDDFLVGRAFADYESGSSPHGRVDVVPGPVLSDLSLENQSIRLLPHEGRYVGNTMAGVGDVDGDGYDDLAVGESTDTSIDYYGTVRLMLGPVGTVDTDVSLEAAAASIQGEELQDQAAYVAAGGDTDGDGLADFFVSAPNADATAGVVYLVTGRDPKTGAWPSSFADADARVRGGLPGDFLGAKEHPDGGFANTEVQAVMTSPGDVNNDGYADLLVGAPSHQDVGGAWLFYGPISGSGDTKKADAALTGAALGDDLGYSTAIAGDVDGDGFDDVLVGVPGPDSAGGSDYLIYGPVSGALTPGDADATFQASAADGTGMRVTGPGDVDGDGLDDLLLNDPSNNGETFLISGLPNW